MPWTAGGKREEREGGEIRVGREVRSCLAKGGNGKKVSIVLLSQKVWSDSKPLRAHSEASSEAGISTLPAGVYERMHIALKWGIRKREKGGQTYTKTQGELGKRNLAE